MADDRKINKKKKKKCLFKFQCQCCEDQNCDIIFILYCLRLQWQLQLCEVEVGKQ